MRPFSWRHSENIRLVPLSYHPDHSRSSLNKVTHDVGALLPLMWTLAIAKLSGDLVSPSFDHGMMHLRRLAYLEEEPPHEFEMLTTRDVMARNVIVLKEVKPRAFNPITT